MSHRLHRMRVAAAALAVIVPTGVVGVGTATAGAASAAPAKPVVCDAGRTYVYIDTIVRPFTPTHIKGYQAPPGGKLTISKTLKSTSTIKASAEAYGEVSGEAGAIFGKVSAKAGFKVAAQGSKTNQASETVTNELAASSKDRYYAAYSGVTKVKGTYHTQQCTHDGTGYSTTTYGDYTSFSRTELEGIALCKQGRYKKGTPPYVACDGTWGNK